MKGFETVFITDSNISEAETQATLEKIEGVIARYEGVTKHKNVWGRRRLAYPIQKKNYGLYHLWYIEGTGEMLKELHKQLGYLEEVLRFQTVSVDDVDAANHAFMKLSDKNYERPDEAEVIVDEIEAADETVTEIV
ncbi:MAG: 30S ribosomal protein S6 [SAR324 cluster bacterium]|nr:30S ribosomal protein S6 [SAR324 cluster bacterium]